ncbi:hypothetical protein CSOJ01_10916 [Colletotrichum sojae]|uniref:Uncharacterized protein n=1 Tax=Colletotrichum sojae TaxID=2175907 RepID=A0A8H6IZ04_9PEZI|nr:hypothetical protein CSOJ01_10916 [Colletotrichum sojae]
MQRHAEPYRDVLPFAQPDLPTSQALVCSSASRLSAVDTPVHHLVRALPGSDGDLQYQLGRAIALRKCRGRTGVSSFRGMASRSRSCRSTKLACLARCLPSSRPPHSMLLIEDLALDLFLRCTNKLRTRTDELPNRQQRCSSLRSSTQRLTTTKNRVSRAAKREGRRIPHGSGTSLAGPANLVLEMDGRLTDEVDSSDHPMRSLAPRLHDGQRVSLEMFWVGSSSSRYLSGPLRPSPVLYGVISSVSSIWGSCRCRWLAEAGRRRSQTSIALQGLLESTDDAGSSQRESTNEISGNGGQLLDWLVHPASGRRLKVAAGGG